MNKTNHKYFFYALLANMLLLCTSPFVFSLQAEKENAQFAKKSLGSETGTDKEDALPLLRKEENQIVAENEFYRIVFDLSCGGMIKEIKSKALKENNTVLRQEDGLDGYLLSNDKSPETKIKNLPKKAILKISSCYKNDKDEKPESSPLAEYKYTFLKSKPAISLEVSVKQQNVFDAEKDKNVLKSWNELSILKFNGKVYAFQGTFDKSEINYQNTFKVGNNNSAFEVLNSKPPETEKQKKIDLNITLSNSRDSFLQSEKEIPLKVIIDSTASLSDIKISMWISSAEKPMENLLLPIEKTPEDYKGDEKLELVYTLNPTLLKCGKYYFNVNVSNQDGECKKSFPISICKGQNNNGMYVMSFDYGLSDENLRELGINCILGINAKMTKEIFSAPEKNMLPEETLMEWKNTLNEALTKDISILLSIDTFRWKGNKELNGVNYEGQPQTYPNPWNPQFRSRCLLFTQETLRELKDFPALKIILLNNETQYHLSPLWDEAYKKMVIKKLGFPMPQEAKTPNSYAYNTHLKPPSSGIINEKKDKFYSFYRWWWEEGEGINILNSEMSMAAKQLAPECITLNKPVTRGPCVYRRGCGLDMIGNWAYIVPDPKTVCMMADELLTQSENKQMLAQGIQLIFSTSQISRNIDKSKLPELLKKNQFIAPSSALFNEAVWLALSRGIDMIFFHGFATMIEKAKTYGGDYVYSNPGLYENMKSLSDTVIKPYGEMIRKLDNIPSDVAFLMSFAARTYSAECGYARWNNIFYEYMYEALQNAHIPANVVYDESIEKGCLKNYKVLILPRCETMTKAVHGKIMEFVRNGGVVIADKYLTADIPVIGRLDNEWKTNKNYFMEPADKRRDKTLSLANELRKLLLNKVNLWVDSENHEVLFNMLQKNKVKYLFVVNDKRTYGDYLGKTKAVLDDGMPQNVKIKLMKTGNAEIYDMLKREHLVPKKVKNVLTVELSLAPGEGRILAIYPEKIGGMKIDSAATVKKGSIYKLKISLLNANNTLLSSGVQPLQVDIMDSQGLKNAYSGYYLAEKGSAEINLPVACNDSGGYWKVLVNDLTAGKSQTKIFKVEE